MTHRRILALASLLLAGTLLGGCAANSTDDGYDSAVPGLASEQYAADSAEEYAGATEVSTDQSVITTGWATVVVTDPAAAATDLRERVEQLSGSVESSWSSASQDGTLPSAELTVRVPADSYQQLLAELPSFGTVQEQSTNAQDVTQTVTDLDARISALQTSIERLTELMEQATTTEDLLSAEDMLTQRQAELDSLTAQLTYLQDQVALSTLTVTFTTRASSGGPSFSWSDAWDNLLYSVYSMLTFLVMALPWIVLAVVVFFVARWAILRKRHRTAAAASVTASSDDAAPRGSSGN